MGDLAPGRLDGRVALITGGAQGIGREIGRRLGAEGAAIVVVDLDAGASARAAAELMAAGIRAVGAAGDVTSAQDADRVVGAAQDAFGALDILVNNAGITRDGPLQRMPDADWRAVHEVVLWGTFCMTRAAAGALRGARDAPPPHHR
jgi:3-oxoacyl-[acyl-carrier protein] reductase